MKSIMDVSLCLCSDNHMFQYFITIVPTKLNTYQIAADTHQYSVTERVRMYVYLLMCDCVFCMSMHVYLCVSLCS